MLSSFWKQKPTWSLSCGVCNLVGETTITEIIHRQMYQNAFGNRAD